MGIRARQIHRHNPEIHHSANVVERSGSPTRI